MDYIGERLWVGELGNFFLVLSFVAPLLATICFFKASSHPFDSSWKKLGRIFFVLDVVAVVVVFSLIYFIIANHYFEYYYAFNHSDRSLEPKYLLSSIWEGQEGSFLLWAFWHAVLGSLLIITAKKWEAPVMTIISFAQVCIASMLLGIHVFDFKIGSNPFLLTRQMFPDAPIFSDPNYLANAPLQDGNGLNQLLQNYWMVIHPPVLFLGFASTIIPFAYAISGLWKKQFGQWTREALPWSLFSAGILGLGIMMGARWAYESLSFGGYWAWDPVENASLVPWLILVAGVHTQVIFNATGHSLRATYLFFILAFVLVLYSTYLTRSGDLQDTSVHAFTGEGLNWQLRLLVLAFALPSILLLIRRYRQIPHIAKEESSYSREFWMFIGSLVLFLSAMFICVYTSLPVINKILNTNFTVADDIEFFYNRIQIFVAIILGILTAFSQYLKYRNTSRSYLWPRLAIPSIIAVVISLLISVFGDIQYNKYGIGFLAAIHLAIFAAVYSVVANAGYVWAGLKGKLQAAGAAVAHAGFGLMLLGILISASKKEVLSINRLNPLNFGPDNKEKGFENLTLFQNIRTDMGKYWATYEKDTLDKFGKKTFFKIEMQRKDNKEKFYLYPDLIKNTKGQEGVSQNPDARHYWNKDIFSYISYASSLEDAEDTASFKTKAISIGDTIFYSNGYMILENVVPNPKNDQFQFKNTDTALMAQLQIKTVDGQSFLAEPLFYVKDNQLRFVPDTVASQGLEVALSRVVNNNQIEISYKESSQLVPFVALKVLEFPFINLLWLGTIIMLIGIGMSIVRRVRLSA